MEGAYIAGMTSDVTVLVVPEPLATGDEVSFAVDYEALVRAVTSPFVTKRCVGQITCDLRGAPGTPATAEERPWSMQMAATSDGGRSSSS